MHLFRYFCRPVVALVLVVAVLFAGCTRAQKKARFMRRADEYFKAGDYEKAKIEYLSALRLDPKTAVAFQQIGIIWLEEGDVVQALQFLSRARELAPNNAIVRAKLAAASFALGDVAAAKKETQALLAQAPSNDAALFLLCDLARTKNEIEDTQSEIAKFPNHENSSFQVALASLLFRKGDRAGGEQAMQQALTFNPKSVPAHLLLAEYSISKKDPAKAEEEFKAASDYSERRSSAKLKYVEFKRRTGAIPDAEALLTKITQNAPDFFPAWLLKAQIAFDARHYEDSLASLGNVLTRDGTNLDAILLRAQVLLAKDDVAKAMVDLERLDKTYGKLPAVKYHLACAYLKSNKAQEAMAKLNEAVALRPTYVEAALLLGQLNLQAGNPQLVVTPMVNLLKTRPVFPEAEILLASAYHALGRGEDAAAMFQDHIKKSPKDAMPYFMLGVTFRQLGKASDAKVAFEKAQELAPNDLASTSELVDLDLSHQDYQSALSRIEVQEKRQPNSATVHLLKGRVFSMKKQWPEAEAALSKAIEMAPNLLDAYDLLVSVYIAQNKWDLAIDGQKNEVAKAPGNFQSLMKLGLLYGREHRDAEALECYEKVISIKPDFSPALNNLAYLYSKKQDQMDKAAALGRKARSLQPGDPDVADTLGWILYRQGAYQEALILLRESAGKLSNPEVQFHLGMANYMMGNVDLARASLQHALESPEKFPGMEQIADRLAILPGNSEAAPSLSLDQLKAITARDPGDVMAQLLLGESLEKAGLVQEASAAYERALQKNPKLFPALSRLADLFAHQMKNTEAALGYAKRAKDLAPEDPKVSGLLGALEFANHHFSVAYALLQESARRLDKDPQILCDFAWAAYSLGKIKESRDAMKSALEHSPSPVLSQDVECFLSMTDLSDGSQVSAHASQVEELIKSRPGYVPALMARAILETQHGDRNAAKQIYSEVLQQFPDFGPAQKQLAAIYLEEPRDDAKAYEFAIKAHHSLPDDPETAQILGKACYRRKDYRGALQLLEEAGRSAPLSVEGQYYLGMTYWQLRDKAKSQQALMDAQSAGLKEPFLSESKHVLEELAKK